MIDSPSDFIILIRFAIFLTMTCDFCLMKCSIVNLWSVSWSHRGIPMDSMRYRIWKGNIGSYAPKTDSPPAVFNANDPFRPHSKASAISRLEKAIWITNEWMIFSRMQAFGHKSILPRWFWCWARDWWVTENLDMSMACLKKDLSSLHGLPLHHKRINDFFPHAGLWTQINSSKMVLMLSERLMSHRKFGYVHGLPQERPIIIAWSSAPRTTHGFWRIVRITSAMLWIVHMD